MRELSLNLLDITQNSITAKASLIEINVVANSADDLLTISIRDNGCGMTDEQVKSVESPFFTTRTTRKVGLGIPLFKMAAEMTGGSLSLSSEVGKGTYIEANFGWTHIDRMPLGDLRGTLTTLIRMHPEVDFIYYEQLDDKHMELDTRELREVLGDVSLDTPDVIQWIEEYYNEGSPFLT